MVIVGQKRDNLALNLTNKDFFFCLLCAWTDDMVIWPTSRTSPCIK